MIEIIKADGIADRRWLERLRGRSGEVADEVSVTVTDIIAHVRADGDAAVREYALKFDRYCPDTLEVSRAELDAALADADPKYVASLGRAIENIRRFHSRQKQQSFIDAQPSGVLMGQRVRGLSRVGIYVPGGTAAYPSSVLMSAVPARIAEVGEIIMATPPGRDGKANADILTAAALAGVDRVFLVGGAQAIAAMAFGTATLPRVDKIVGPGNIYVATAKRLLYGVVDIDMIAGPSEILIVADETANPRYLAADMLSQAEHDRLSSAILLTTDERVAAATASDLAKQAALLPRAGIIAESLANYSVIMLCRDSGQMIALANELAPEHLEVMTANPMEYLGKLDNAGSVFLGQYSPEPLGDYYAGPNHVLPTSGSARFFSPLGVDSFIKKSSYIYYTEQALEAARDDIVRIAGSEGLDAHANAVKIRFE